MQTEDVDGKTLETWTPQEVSDAMGKGEIVLIDVRTPQEYMIDHIEGALLMPLSDFVPGALPTGGDKRLVFYCGSGVRSGKVSRMVLSDGADKVAHMEGGMAGWKQAGLPHVQVDMATGAPKKSGS